MISNHKDAVILKCNVDGSKDLLQYEWFRNSEKLNTGVQNIHFDNDKLIIRNPSSFDNGLYRCIATNNAGRVMSKKGYTLKLIDTTINNNNELNNNYNRQMITGCIPRNFLKKNSNKNQIQNNDNDNNKSKQFLCRGKRGGDRTLNTNSAIIHSLSSNPSGINNNGINIVKHPIKTIAKENDHVELTCKYSNIPNKYKSLSILLRWRKDGKILRQLELGSGTTTTVEPNMEVMLREDSRISINRQNGSLIFSSVIGSDSGVYDCQILIDGQSNSIISSESAELIVIEQLKFAPQPTSKNLELGTVGKIHCKAQGTPQPQVKWIKVSKIWF